MNLSTTTAIWTISTQCFAFLTNPKARCWCWYCTCDKAVLASHEITGARKDLRLRNAKFLNSTRSRGATLQHVSHQMFCFKMCSHSDWTCCNSYHIIQISNAAASKGSFSDNLKFKRWATSQPTKSASPPLSLFAPRLMCTSCHNPHSCIFWAQNQILLTEVGRAL